jgi:hypothetical protein
VAIHEPEEQGDDFPVPETKERKAPLVWILLACGLIALIALLALSY